MIKKAILLVFVLAPLFVNAQTISIESPLTANIGESFNVHIRLETNENVYAAQFDLLFNPNIVEAVKISYANKNIYTTYSLNNHYGKVKFGMTCIGNCTLPRDLVNITFKSLSHGKNIFHLQNIKTLNPDLKEINLSTSSKEIIIIKTTDTFNRYTDIQTTLNDSKIYKNALNISTNDNIKKSNESVHILNKDNNKTNNISTKATKANENNESVSESEPTKSVNTSIETGNEQYSIFLWIILIGAIVLILITLKMMKK